MMNAVPSHSSGFTLAEILLSLLIMSGTLATLLQGIQVAFALNQQSSFEEMASFFAEREMETMKSDLLEGRIKTASTQTNGRFRLPAGWSTRFTVSNPDSNGVVHLLCQIQKADNSLALDSYLYCPPADAPVGK